jgi:hypothetical protein
MFMVRLANRNVITGQMMQWESSHPALFYSGSMFLLIQMVQMFDPLRRIYAQLRPALLQMLR